MNVELTPDIRSVVWSPNERVSSFLICLKSAISMKKDFLFTAPATTRWAKSFHHTPEGSAPMRARTFDSMLKQRRETEKRFES